MQLMMKNKNFHYKHDLKMFSMKKETHIAIYVMGGKFPQNAAEPR